jgi:hypothetical protein
MKGSWFEAGPGKKHRTLPKKKLKQEEHGCLLHKYRALSSNPSAAKKKKRKRPSLHEGEESVDKLASFLFSPQRSFEVLTASQTL